MKSQMKFKFEIDEADVQIIMQALGELPLKIGVKTFASIDLQYGRQKTAQTGQKEEALATPNK